MWVYLFILFVAVFQSVYGHGYMIEPISRSSLWRSNKGAPINYDDNQLFCGGFSKQFEQNGGACGVCGDNFADKQPRENENGGKFGNGVIGKFYRQGDNITANIIITASHFGHFEFSICPLDSKNQVETEECFQRISLSNGDDVFVLRSKNSGKYRVELQLPKNLTCARCVLRWHWRSGNNWGFCGNNFLGGLGCGPQETFRNCADIAILPKK